MKPKRKNKVMDTETCLSKEIEDAIKRKHWYTAILGQKILEDQINEANSTPDMSSDNSGKRLG